jgi:hypothetical protein
MSFFERIGKIDNRIIYALLVVALMVPLMNPMGLPISVTAHTQRSFNAIDKLQAGDIVLMDVGYSVSGASDVEPQTIAILKHLFGKGVKIVFVAYQVEGGMIIEKLVKPYEAAGKKYGEDFTNLGYLVGYENAMSTYARGMKQAFPRDHRGQLTESQPILANIKTASDFKMLLFFTTNNSDMYVRQFTQYKIPIIGGLINTIALQAEPYVQAGQLNGILVGLRGGAEYEVLMKSPGLGVASMDAQSMGHLLIIVMMILANVSYFATRKAQSARKGAAQ